ncbi:hypothetical protein LNKW23_17860 [Paralimibaculum aggregatum]|uniref:Uncharacterized protein n=1 Tax=Paralimibaculum aggregatum TaxID=3036245 RepID=A0ABQ6LMZ8_9RHOB|nr:hypothetical protein [Limibaculum sp. NKW23]GMG82573.1 hypothetical protein LNKW23_17860 [Limibaculum sp. NKW23]
MTVNGTPITAASVLRWITAASTPIVAGAALGLYAKLNSLEIGQAALTERVQAMGARIEFLTVQASERYTRLDADRDRAEALRRFLAVEEAIKENRGAIRALEERSAAAR